MKHLVQRFKLGINPIIVKELRSRMRGPRAFITITVVLLLTGAILFAILQIVLATSRYSTIISPQVGQGMFAALALLELFMIATITPAVTAGAISGEKEKQTYEMLMATPLSPARILWGKFLSAMSYVFLILFAAIPLASIVFIFGGVAPREMIKVYLVLLVIACTFGIIGLFMSALFGRTGWATVASYITVILITLGPLFVAIVIGILRQAEPPRWLLTPSPISALSAALAPSMGQNNSFFQVFYALSGIWNMGIAPISQTEIPRPLYHYSLPFYFIFSLILYLFTMRLVRPTHRFRIKPREVITGLAIVAAFCGFLVTAYLLTAPRYEWAVRNNQVAPTAVPVFQTNQIYPPPQGQIVELQPNNSSPTPTKSQESESYPSVMEPIDRGIQVEVYSTVIRRLYTKDHTFKEGSPNWPIVYLVQNTDDSVGDPNTPKLDSTQFDKGMMADIIKSLKDLNVDIHWVTSPDDVPKDPQTGTVQNNGVIITLGNIHIVPDGTLQVPASLYFSSLGAAGKTYILADNHGLWEIIGTTGVEWIS